jgi:hypothetical protein
MQNRSRRKGDLIPTTSALPAPRLHDLIRTLVPAPWADEALWPAALRQILLASCFGSEPRLEFAQGFWKRWAGHAPILQLVAC